MRVGPLGRAGRTAALLVVTLVALGPVAACSSSGPKAGEAQLVVAGRALVVRQAGKRESITGRTTVKVGDAVTLSSGTGELRLKGGSALALRSGVDGAKDSVLVMGPIPVLQAGDLLVTTSGDQPVSADQTKVTVSNGSARVTRSVGVRVAAYDGRVALDSAGQERTIAALREMEIPALGQPPEAPQPFHYDPTDPWDRRFLGEAIDLGQRLEALANGYTQNLAPGQGHTVAFYEQIIPDLAHQPQFTPDLLDPNRTPGETLIGAAIADLGHRGTFAERWASVFAFRGQGAKWGLVALDQGVDRTPLLGAVTTAVQGSPLAVGPPRTTVPPAGPTPTTTTTTTAPTTGPTTPTTRPPSPTTTVPPTGGGGNGLLNPILDPVTNLLSGVLKAIVGGLLPG